MLRSRLFAVLTLTVLFSLVPSRVVASIGFQPVNPEELKMTSEPKAPGATAVLLYRQVDRDDGKVAHEDSYFRIKILKEKGREYANVEIPFDPSVGTISGLHARTIRPDGTIVSFDGKVFEKTIVKTKGVKYQAKTFTLPDVQVGGIIEYYYTLDFPDYYIFDSHWIISNELFTKTARFSLKAYRATNAYQTAFGLRWTWKDIPEGPKEDAQHVLRLEVHDVPAFQTEDYMPPENDLKARVDFTYTEDDVEQDVAKFWKKAGKKLNDKAESFAGKSREVSDVVAQTVGPNDTPEEKARKLYVRVQQIKNLSFEVEKTEQQKKRDKESAEVNSAGDALKRGYGYKRDITRTYLALVRTAGLEAFAVKVSDRRNYFFNAGTRDVNKLDRWLVLLRFKDHDVYCDPGDKFAPFGQLPWEETSAPGLRLDKNGGEWISTPQTPSSVTQTKRVASLKLDAETGSLEGKLTISFAGIAAAQARMEEANEDGAARKKYLEDEVRDAVPASIEVELINQPEWNNNTVPLVAEYKLKVPGWGSSAGRRTLLAQGLFGRAVKSVFEHAERVHPVYFAYPTQETDDVTIELPEGWKVSSVPRPTEQVQKGVFAFIAKAENAQGKLHVTRDFSQDLLLIPVSSYDVLRHLYQMIRTSDEEQIVLLSGATN